jgi:hypothetical protein
LNAYGQRWAPWSWAFLFSIILWAVIIGSAVALLGGCISTRAGKVGEGGSLTYTEKVKVERPPKEWGECPQGEAVHCCCDLSRDGVISCRCPHPGGSQ